MEVAELVERILAGDRRAIARAISMVEDGDEGLAELSAGLFPHTGGAYTIGLTGSPGVGKSTLAGELVRAEATGCRLNEGEPAEPAEQLVDVRQLEHCAEQCLIQGPHQGACLQGGSVGWPWCLLEELLQQHADDVER